MIQHVSKYPAWATVSDVEMKTTRAHYLALLKVSYEAFQLENVTPLDVAIIERTKHRGDTLAAATSDGSWVDADAWDCSVWLRSLFNQYSERKAAMEAALNPYQLQQVSLDFSALGNIPRGAATRDQQDAAWDIANLDGLTGLPTRVQTHIDATKGR